MGFRFTRIVIENWRNFKKVDVNLERRVFLVGPNASGKSNFLGVFRFLRHIVAVGGGFHAAVEEEGGVSRLRCLAATRNSNILIHAVIGNDKSPRAWEYELRFNQSKDKPPTIKTEKVWREKEEIFTRPDEHDKDDPERLTQTYLEQVHANREYREIAEFFKSLKYFHVVPQLVREPFRWIGEPDDPLGSDLIEQMARTSTRTRKNRLGRLSKALELAVPQLTELDLKQDKTSGEWHLQARYEHWRPTGAFQSEQEFSDGTLRLLGLLWAAMEEAGPLLLEEPELSLHPEVIRRIPQILARIQRKTGRQIFISTHSSDLLRDDGIGTDEVLMLMPQSEGTKVQPASALRDVRRLLDGGLNLADIVIPKTKPARVEQLSLYEV